MYWHALDKFHIESANDWKYITYSNISQLGGSTLLKKVGGLFPFLNKVCPELEWEKPRGMAAPKSQSYLLRSLRKIFRDVEILKNYKSTLFPFKETQHKMEFDVYIPKYSLAVEYQGEQHYSFTGAFGHHDEFKLRDEEKQQACASAGVTLLLIPYWWDRSLSSLKATIHKLRWVLLIMERFLFNAWLFLINWHSFWNLREIPVSKILFK